MYLILHRNPMQRRPPPPKPKMHIAYSPSYRKIYKFHFCFRKIYKYSPVFIQFTLFCLILVFCFPLLWPWCIYASCFTCTGRRWAYVFESLLVLLKSDTNLPFPRLSLALGFTFFLELKCTENASVWLTPCEALYKYLYTIQYNTMQYNTIHCNAIQYNTKL